MKSGYLKTLRNRQALRNLVRYSLLASIAALMQASAGFFPGPGHVLGAFNTLPIAMAAFISPKGGLFCYIISSWLTFIIMPAQMPLLILCTAPLGLALGTGIHFNAKMSFCIISSAVILTMGMAVLTVILGIPAFGSILKGKGFGIILSFYTCFALVYSYAWYNFAGRIIYQLNKLGLKLR